MARIGGGGPTGVGRSLHKRGLHPTSVFGRIGAAVAASVLMRLTPQQTEYAIGVAATTAGGLVGSFGTHSKPFHGGKAAMDGIIAAEMAKEGFQSSTKLLELEKGLYDALIQDRKAEIPAIDFSYWETQAQRFQALCVVPRHPRSHSNLAQAHRAGCGAQDYQGVRQGAYQRGDRR